MKARYFATPNLKAPFVLVFGHWPDRSALVKNSLINGVCLGTREALECEIEDANASTRCMFFYWKSLRAMLWTHKCRPDLQDFYPGLISNIRKRLWDIKQLQKIIARKQAAKDFKAAAIAQAIAENEAKRIAANSDFKDLIQSIEKYKMEFTYVL